VRQGSQKTAAQSENYQFATAWHRHIRLVFLAQLFLVRLQIKFKKKLLR
jgi:hypothetical protein